MARLNRELGDTEEIEQGRCAWSQLQVTGVENFDFCASCTMLLEDIMVCSDGPDIESVE